MRASFKKEDEYITMVRGDTLSFNMEIEGIGQNLDSAFFSCRKDHDEDYVFQKSLEDGISLIETDGDTRVYAVRVAPEDTANLEAGKYYYDLEIGVNNDIYTVLKGVLEIEKDVTF